jgi:hypothetical protein
LQAEGKSLKLDVLKNVDPHRITVLRVGPGYCTLSQPKKRLVPEENCGLCEVWLTAITGSTEKRLFDSYFFKPSFVSTIRICGVAGVLDIAKSFNILSLPDTTMHIVAKTLPLRYRKNG